MLAPTFTWMNGLSKSTARLLQKIFVLEWQFKLVFLSAVLVMAYMQLFYPFYDPGGDSDTDFFMARYLLHLPGGLYISSHAPGMAMFLILSGVIFLNSWKPLIFLYAVMSVAIPCFIYATIRPYHRTWAMIITLIVIIGLVPFAYSRFESYDHLFLFLEFFSIYLSALFFRNYIKNKRLVYLIAIVMFSMTLVKPIAAFLYWIFLICAIFLRGIDRLFLFKATFLYLVLMGIWVAFDWSAGNGGFPEWFSPKNYDQRRFAATYYQPNYFLFNKTLQRSIPVISVQDGPASKALYQAISEYAKNHINQWRAPTDIYSRLPHTFFGKYASNPDQLVEEIFKKPNSLYFNFILESVASKWGMNSGEALLWSVAAEHYNTGFLGLLKNLWRHTAKIITGPVTSAGWRNLLSVYSFSTLREDLGGDLSWYILVDPDKLRNFLNPTLGPYSKEFYDAIYFYVHELPGFWEHSNPTFEKFTARPDDLYQYILQPTSIWDISLIEGWYYVLFLDIYGQNVTNTLFSHVVFEAYKKYPKSFLLFVDSFLEEMFAIQKYDLFRVTDYFNYLIRRTEINYEQRKNGATLTAIGPKLYQQLSSVVQGDAYSRLVTFLWGVMHCYAPFFVFIMVFLLMTALMGRGRLCTIFLIGMYLYFVLVFTFFGNFGSDRYSDIFILIPLIIIGIALSSFHDTKKMFF